MKKILVIEDEIIIAEHIRNILVEESFIVTGIVDNFESALKAYKELCPDMIICDIRIKGDKTGIDIANTLFEKGPIPIIFITAFSSDDIFDNVANFKDTYYITKPITRSQLIAMVKIAASKYKKKKMPADITTREKIIIDLITKGMTSHSIAEKLSLSVETVKTHRKNIFSKFDVHSVAELIHKLS